MTKTPMGPSKRKWISIVCLAWGLCIALIAPPTFADTGCTDCGEPAFPDAEAFLATHGYPSPAYRVLTAWIEAARTSESTFVRGFHMLNRATNVTFDLYFNASQQMLSSSELAQLGITTKSWHLKPVQTWPEVSRGGEKSKSAPPVIRGTSPAVQPPDTIQLPSVDKYTLMEEDENAEETTGKGVLRIGVFVPVPDKVAVQGTESTGGSWQPVEGGWLWSIALYSQDAVGQRIHLTQLHLPVDASMVLYNLLNPSEAYPIQEPPPSQSPDLWTPTCFSEWVAIECFVPETSSIDKVNLEISQIAHIYRDFSEIPWKAAGSCNLDVECKDSKWPADASPAEWAATASGVGGIGTIGQPGALWCTGSLIVDTDPSTQIPYFLTANHCVGVQKTSGANSCEFYWMYQRTGCGSVPNPIDVPRTTGGADLLATSSVTTGTDFTLLRLRAIPPAGLTYLGWTSEAPPLGTETVTVHHPSGDRKRISFSQLVNQYDTCTARKPQERFHQVLWHHGTTEHGSSGCPLMRRDTQQIIGQLWGGQASCVKPQCPDYYGRFDVTFPMAASYLHPFNTPPEASLSCAKDAGTVSEGNTHATFTVVLSHAPGPGGASVQFHTVDGSAQAGRDYESTTGEVTFLETEYEKTFDVPIIPDYRLDPVMSFSVVIDTPVNCSIVTSGDSAEITIEDDDPDMDGDGLTDNEEIYGYFGYITNPANPDSDDDGISDGQEITFGHDPNDPMDLPEIPDFYIPWFTEN